MNKQLLAKLLAALAETTVSVKAKTGRKAGGRMTSDKLAQITVAAFTKAGFRDVQPKVNVKTYNAFLKEGRRVKKGQTGIQCGPFTLFHVDQTEADTGPAPTQPKAVNDNAAPKLPTIEELEALLATLKGQSAHKAQLDAEYGPAV